MDNRYKEHKLYLAYELRASYTNAIASYFIGRNDWWCHCDVNATLLFLI